MEHCYEVEVLHKKFVVHSLSLKSVLRLGTGGDKFLAIISVAAVVFIFNPGQQ